MDILIMAAQMILGLSILVGLHEFGHLLAAKAFGMRVEQYSIGFPPKIFSFKYGETLYSIGAIPLGGFVKISGMIDESLDLEKMKEEPQPWEFRAKPAWQRLIVMMGGIIVNVITGIIIFIIIVFVYGETNITKEELNKNGIYAHTLAQELGLRTGDRIVEVNGEDYQYYDDITSADVLLADDAYYTVDRDGDIIDIPIPSNFLEKFSPRKNRDVSFIDYISTFSVGKVDKKMGAAAGGLMEGDRIESVDGTPVKYFHEFKNVAQSLKGQMAHFVVTRNEQPIELDIEISEDGKAGFVSVQDIEFTVKHYTFLEAIPKGTKDAFSIVFINIKAFGKIFSGDLNFSESVSGPIGIAKIFGGTWNWPRFWNLVGLLSMILAFMNFLPIPALDGGHVMFLTFEIVSGHKPSDKFMEVAQKVGMVILLGLMVFVIFNDIFKEIWP
jgi:regulator of sigma E protease